MRLSELDEVNKLAEDLKEVRETHAAMAEGVTAVSIRLHAAAGGSEDPLLRQSIGSFEIDVHDQEFAQIVQLMRASLKRTATELVNALAQFGVRADA